MKKAELKELIKQSMLEISSRGESGEMTPEEEKMVADYEKEQDAKHALDKEETMEEDVIAEAERIVTEWNSKKQL